MADSPQKGSGSHLNLTLTIDGQTAADNIRVISVVVNKTLNRIPSAKLVIFDGDMPTKDFPLSNEDTFKPGAEIEIKAGYGDGSNDDIIYKGIVVRHGIAISGDNFSRLEVECRDKAAKMAIGRKSANFIDQKDSDIITTLIGNSAGLSSEVDATTVTYKELVQYYCSDWDFMLSRAEVNGLIVNVDEGKVTVKAPATDGTPVLTVTYGVDLFEFHGDVDARTQLSSVSSTGWDLQTQAVVTQTATPPTLNAQGDLKSDDLAAVTAPESFNLQTAVPLESAALKAWADGCQLKAGLARVRGRMSFQGSAKAKPGELVEVVGVGNRFSGNVYVSGVNHTLIDGDWTTEVTFGMAPDWFAERRDLVAPSAAGLLPGVDGLQVGVVMKLDEDPASENRIQVSVPVLQAETQGVWARLASSYASDSIGMLWVPEIGDEVILGYFNGDPGNPVILGSLYSSKRQPPIALTAENNTKTIVTRSKLTVEFDEDKKVITIVTPGKNSIVISDDDKSIVLKDQNSNSVTLNSDGIALDSAKDIKISAKGKVTIDAVGEIGVTSKADVKLSGLNVNAEAQVGLVAKGSATAEVSASGQTTVKGAMVMIN